MRVIDEHTDLYLRPTSPGWSFGLASLARAIQNMRSGVNLQDEFLSGHYHYPCFAQGANTWKMGIAALFSTAPSIYPFIPGRQSEVRCFPQTRTARPILVSSSSILHVKN